MNQQSPITTQQSRVDIAVMGQDLQTSASIALPAFGTGVGGFPLEECARLMIATIRAHHAKTLRLARLVLFGKPAYDTFVDVARAAGQP